MTSSGWSVKPATILRYDQRSAKSSLFRPAIFQERTIRQVIEDAQGNLWLGTHGRGLFKWDAHKGRFLFEEGLEKFLAIPNDIINYLALDSLGELWVATSKNGAYVIHPSTNQIQKHLFPDYSGTNWLPEEGVSCILHYNDSTVLVSTSTQIIVYEVTKDTSYVLASAEKISGHISALQRDKLGYIWVSTTNGLYRINMSKRAFVRFDRRDGIVSEEFSLASSYVLNDGRLIFGAADRFLVFQPEEIDLQGSSPKVIITGFHLLNRPLSVDSLLQLQKIKLKSKQNSLVIEYSSLTYNSLYTVQYKMEGLDEDWRSNKLYSAVYSYIPPGDYTFHLRALDSEGNFGETTRLSLSIKAPLFRSWWFYSVLTLLLASMAFWMDSQRMKRKELIYKMRTDIATNLHREIDIALNNINILSEMAFLKTKKDIQKSKEYIRQINLKSQNMIVAMDDMLWAIRPENDNLAKLMDRLEEYAGMISRKPGTMVKMTYDEKMGSYKLDMRLRQIILRTLKTFINHILRTGASEVLIHLGMDRSNLVISLQFDTCQCHRQQLTNFLQRQEHGSFLESINAKVEKELRDSWLELTVRISR